MPAIDHGILLRDISQGQSRRGGALTAEEHLLRISEDPLLVREVLYQPPSLDASVSASIVLRGDSVISLARLFLAHRSLRQDGGIRRPEYLQSGESLHEPSLAPVSFIPSQQDREKAVEHSSLTDDPADNKAAGTSVMGVGLALLLLTFALLFLAAIF